MMSWLWLNIPLMVLFLIRLVGSVIRQTWLKVAAGR